MDSREKRDLQQLMVRLADGDRAAFQPVFRTAWPVVQAFAAKLMAGAAEAEDAAQAAMLKLFERAHEFDVERDALPWILGIVFNEVRTARRKSLRRREVAVDDSLAENMIDTAASAEESLLRGEAHAVVSEMMGQISEQDRETLLAAAGLRARPLIAAATFRKRVSRALERLKRSSGRVV